jgi:hypothetical protein
MYKYIYTYIYIDKECDDGLQGLIHICCLGGLIRKNSIRSNNHDICISIYIYVTIKVFICIYICINIYTYVRIYMYVYLYVSIFICIYIFVNEFI